MNFLHLNIDVPGGSSAILTLSKPLTPESLCQLEDAVEDRLHRLSRELGAASSDAGALEYASWVPQPVPAR